MVCYHVKTAMLNLRCDATSTTRLETARHHAQETYDKDLITVQEMEVKLGIVSRWKLGDVEWQNTGHLMAQQKYWCTLNNLESLVVAHIFELSKMNQAGTGESLITEVLHDTN